MQGRVDIPSRRLSALELARTRRRLAEAVPGGAVVELLGQVTWAIEEGALRRFDMPLALNIALKKSAKVTGAAPIACRRVGFALIPRPAARHNGRKDLSPGLFKLMNTGPETMVEIGNRRIRSGKPRAWNTAAFIFSKSSIICYSHQLVSCHSHGAFRET